MKNPNWDQSPEGGNAGRQENLKFESHGDDILLNLNKGVTPPPHLPTNNEITAASSLCSLLVHFVLPLPLLPSSDVWPPLPLLILSPPTPLHFSPPLLVENVVARPSGTRSLDSSIAGPSGKFSSLHIMKESTHMIKFHKASMR